MRYKEVLKKYGVTQAQLAERLGINPVSVSRLLSDDNDMRTSTLLKIAEAIGCRASEFFDAPEDNGPFLSCPHCGGKLNVKLETI